MQIDNTATEVTESAPLIDPIDPPEAAPASAPADEAGQADTTTEKTDDDGKQQEDEHADRDEQGRFKPRIQKRIDELTHARRAAERDAAYWRGVAEKSQQATPAPKAHDFATDEEYEAAARRHEIRETAREISAENAQEAANHHQQDAQRAVADTYNQRVQAAVTRIPDFLDVVGKADIKISSDMLQALQESEHGPDLVYQLAKNPDEAARLASMGTRQLDREIGRMEALITSKGAVPAAPATAPAPAVRTTSAPPPVKPAGAGGAPPNGNLDTMSQSEFEAAMRARGSKHI